jgi:glycerophosphoryl diester phosphodiesterase
MQRRVLWAALGAVVLFNIAVWPAYPVKTHPFFDGAPNFFVVAHRGGAAIGPENTIEAGRASADLGVDALEFDLHETKDGRLVLMHDDTVDRTTSGQGRVADLTLAELQTLDAGGGAKIPTLEEVLEAFPASRIVLEIKPDTAETAGKSCGIIQAAGAENRVLMGSFDDTTIKAFRAACPRVATSFSADEGRMFLILANLRLSRFWPMPAQAVLAPEEFEGRRVLDANVINAARQRGLRLWVWTVNDPADMKRLVDARVGGLITDAPHLAVAVRPKPTPVPAS